MKFRKRQIIVDAFRLGYDYIPKWLDEVDYLFNIDCNMVIPTLEGDMVANLGDYIIRGVNGEVYPCKADIFMQNYEEVCDGTYSK